MSNFSEFSPRYPSYMAGSGGGGGRKRPEIPTVKDTSATSKSKVEQGDKPKTEESETKAVRKERKTGGKEAAIQTFFHKVVDRKGNPDTTMYKPTGGLSEARVNSIFSAKALTQKHLLAELTSEFQGLAIRQVSALRETVKVIGGASGTRNYEIAAAMTSALDEILTLTNDPTTPERLREFFSSWTWLVSNGFLLGDEKTHMDRLSKTNTTQRAVIVKKFDDERPEFEARMRDKVGEEIYQMTRWIRARAHNDSLPQRIEAAKKGGKKGKDLDVPEFQKMAGPKPIENGIIFFLASKASASNELKYIASKIKSKTPAEKKVVSERKRAIIARIGSLGYTSYAPVSKQRREEHAAAKKSARQTMSPKELRAAELQEKQEADALEAQKKLREQEQIEQRLIKLRAMVKIAEERITKSQAILKAIEESLRQQPGPLRSIAIRIDPQENPARVPGRKAGKEPRTLLYSLQKFVRDAKKFDVKDSRGIVAKLAPRLTGVTRPTGAPLTQIEFDKLKGLFDRTERRHWQQLEKHINKIVREIPENMRKALGMEKIDLDKLEVRQLSMLMTTLKQGFGFAQIQLQEETKADLLFLQKDVLPVLRKILSNLPPDAPNRQSVDSRIKFLDDLTNTNVFLNGTKIAQIKKAASRYRSGGIK